MFKNQNSKVISKAVQRFFEGDPVPEPAGGTGNPNPTPTPTPTPTPAPGPGFVAQEVVTRLVKQAEDKAKAEKTKYVSELETLRQSSSLTEQEKANLTARIEEMQATLQTKEQQAQTELQRLQKKYDSDVATRDKERQLWQQRYENKLKSVDFRDAAQQHEAFDGEQIEAILSPMTQVVEEIGEDGKPTGELISKVDFMGEDKEGKPVKLKLSVSGAVKAMTEMPKYANLFKNKVVGGLGGQGGNGAVGQTRMPNLDKMSPQQYKANREQIRSRMAAGTE